MGQILPFSSVDQVVGLGPMRSTADACGFWKKFALGGPRSRTTVPETSRTESDR
jgi:hypothetical protein